MRTTLPRVLVVAAAACLAFQASATAVTNEQIQRERDRAERRGERVDDELDAARDALSDTRADRQDTLAELARIDAERTALAAELDALNADLSDAEDRLATSEQALRRTEAEVSATNAELARNAEELEVNRDLLQRRVRASYMRGGVGMGDSLLDLDVATATDLGVSLQYLRAMAERDTDQVQHIATLEQRNEAALERLDELHALQDEVRTRREGERDQVADLVAERQVVADRLDAVADEHATVLARLEADAQRYAAAIDELEAESAAIEDRLAELAAEQRRARAGSASGASAGSAPAPSSGGGFQWPVNGAITSGFGYRTHPVLGTRRLHAGVDFGAPTGTPIVSVADGTVVSAGWHGGYGNAVIVDHGGGLATLYGHQSRLAVSTGTRVSRGQVVGYVGSTGMSTGPHLHLELRRNGTPIDPMPYL